MPSFARFDRLDSDHGQAARPSRQDGLTVIELMIYCSFLAILGVPLVSVLLTSAQTTVENDTMNRIATRNRTAMHRVSEEIRRAIATTLNVQNGGNRLSFVLENGYDGTNVIPGATVQFDLELVPSEEANGKDDNQNGRIDEGQLVFRNLNTNEALTLCQGVDLAASSFTLNGSTVTLNLSNSGSLYRNNTPFTVVRTLSVLARN